MLWKPLSTYIRVVYIHMDGLKEDTCIYDVTQYMYVDIALIKHSISIL